MRATWSWTLPFFNAEGAGGGASGGGNTPGAPAGGGGDGKGAGGGDSGTPDLVKAAAENSAPGGKGGAGSGGDSPAGAGAPYWPEGLPETLSGFKGANDRETI